MARREMIIKQLAPDELVFVEAFLETGNASEAYRRTGNKYTSNSLANHAHQMKRRPHVAAEIAFRMRSEVMDANEVLMRLARIARSNIADYLDIDENGYWNVNLAKAKNDRKLGVVKSIEATKYGTKVTLHDPMKALELIGKAHALWVDVKANEDWQAAAIRDIRSGKLDAWDLFYAFKDMQLVIDLYNQSGEDIPEQFLLEVGTDDSEASSEADS